MRYRHDWLLIVRSASLMPNRYPSNTAIKPRCTSQSQGAVVPANCSKSPCGSSEIAWLAVCSGLTASSTTPAHRGLLWTPSPSPVLRLQTAWDPSIMHAFHRVADALRNCPLKLKWRCRHTRVLSTEGKRMRSRTRKLIPPCPFGAASLNDYRRG